MFRASRLSCLVLSLFFVAFCAVGGMELSAEPRFPPPEFPPGYEKPIIHELSRNIDCWYSPAWLGAAITVVLTFLASWLALVMRSRRGLLAIAVASIVILGFWRQGCVCAVGSIQNISAWLAGVLPGVSIPILILFVTPILLTLFFGRTFCSGVCPLGAIQEILCVRWIKVPFWLDRILSLVPYLYLGLAVWLATCGGGFIICKYDPFVSLFRLSANHPIAILTAFFVIVSLIVPRPYCRYLCPMGAILAVAARFSSRRAAIAPQTNCVQCKLCETVCPIDAIEPPTVAPSSSERRRGRIQLAFALAFSVVALLSGWVLCGGLSDRDAIRFARLVVACHPDYRRAQLYFAAPTNEQLDKWSEVWEERQANSATSNSAGTSNTSGASAPIPAAWQRQLDVREASDKQKISAEQWRARVSRIEISLAKGAPWFGLYVGLIFAWKWLEVSVRRRNEGYHILPDRCFCCGRCFNRCPESQTISPVCDLR